MALQGGGLSPEGSPSPADEYSADYIAMTDVLGQIKLESDQHRFFGKSSHFMLVKEALEFKKEYTGEESADAGVLGFRRREFWSTPLVSIIINPYLTFYRRLFTLFKWEFGTTDKDSPQYIFPEDDLMISLVHIYFTCVNWNLPFLHRPTFENDIADRLYLRDSSFGANVLLVCAVASRYTNDPRVFLEGSNAPQSCGWKYFDQVRKIRRSLLIPPTLFELQFFCVRSFLTSFALGLFISRCPSSSLCNICMAHLRPKPVGLWSESASALPRKLGLIDANLLVINTPLRMNYGIVPFGHYPGLSVILRILSC